jgi:hypothetical protein
MNSDLTEREIEVLHLTDRTQDAVYAWREGMKQRQK